MKLKFLFFTWLVLTSTLMFQTVFAEVEFSPPPNSLQELIDSSDLIIVGKIKDILDNSEFHGYQDNAAELKETTKMLNISLGIYKTDLLIQVNRVLKADSTAKDNKVVLRLITPQLMNFDSIRNNTKNNHDKVSKQVFFLRKNPDGVTYSINTVMGALHFKSVSGSTDEKVIFKFDGKEQPPFGMDMSAQLFLNEVERTAK